MSEREVRQFSFWSVSRRPRCLGARAPLYAMLQINIGASSKTFFNSPSPKKSTHSRPFKIVRRLQNIGIPSLFKTHPFLVKKPVTISDLFLLVLPSCSTLVGFSTTSDLRNERLVFDQVEHVLIPDLPWSKSCRYTAPNQKISRTPWDHLSNIPWESSFPCESENFTWETSHVESFVKFHLISISH